MACHHPSLFGALEGQARSAAPRPSVPHFALRDSRGTLRCAKCGGDAGNRTRVQRVAGLLVLSCSLHSPRPSGGNEEGPRGMTRKILRCAHVRTHISLASDASFPLARIMGETVRTEANLSCESEGRGSTDLAESAENRTFESSENAFISIYGLQRWVSGTVAIPNRS